MKHRGRRRDDLSSAAGAIGVSLSDDAISKLADFEALLREKALPLGFVSEADERRLTERHIVDSLRAAAEVLPTDRKALDLGSGAGLPGIILAIVVPDLRVGLVETQRRRVAFLELAVERLNLANAEPLRGRAEDLEGGTADLCTARAFAPANRAWEVAERVLAPEGRLVYFAGAATSVAAPLGARILASRAAPLESSGPLVIMAR